MGADVNTESAATHEYATPVILKAGLRTGFFQAYVPIELDCLAAHTPTKKRNIWAIENYCEINPGFGTLNRGISLLLRFVIALFYFRFFRFDKFFSKG